MNNNKINFSAIDFETATGKRNSACAVSIVSVKNAEIIEEWYTLIKPPNNYYSQMCTNVHGLEAFDTYTSFNFKQIYFEIEKRLINIPIVAHNSSFDKSVFFKTAEYYNIQVSDKVARNWYCTLKLYRKLKKIDTRIKNLKLNTLCDIFNIELEHHNALSDTVACAKLFIKILQEHY